MTDITDLIQILIQIYQSKMIVDDFLTSIENLTAKLKKKNQNLFNEFKIQMLTFQRQIKRSTNRTTTNNFQTLVNRKLTPNKDKNLSTRNQTFRFYQDKQNNNPNIQKQSSNALLDQYKQEKSIQINTEERNRNLQKFKSANDIFQTKQRPQSIIFSDQPQCAEFYHQFYNSDETQKQNQDSFLNEQFK